MTINRLIVLTVCAGLLGTLYILFSAALDTPMQRGDGPRPELARGAMTNFVFHRTPQEVPDITFTNAAGETLTLADFRGRTILLNLWATWCAPCLKEMPALDALQGEMGSPVFEVVALSLDKGEEARELVETFYARTDIQNMRLYQDTTARSMFAFKTPGLPTTLLIGPDGREIGRLLSDAEWNSPAAKRLVAAYLPEQSAEQP